jgi:hypothetical protein
VGRCDLDDNGILEMDCRTARKGREKYIRAHDTPLALVEVCLPCAEAKGTIVLFEILRKALLTLTLRYRLRSTQKKSEIDVMCETSCLITIFDAPL